MRPTAFSGRVLRHKSRSILYLTLPAAAHHQHQHLIKMSAKCATAMPIIGKIKRKGFCRLLQTALVPGLTVGFMIVPQAIAYALLAGLPPIYGLYSSTMTVFVYSLFGSSSSLSVGPVAMVSLLTKGVIDGTLPTNASEPQMIQVAIVLAFVVGCLQLLMGMLRLGSITKLLSHDVLIGFTSVTSGETCLETFNFQSVRTDCMFSIFLVMVVEEEEPTIRTTPFSPRPRLFWNQSDPLVAVEILCTNPDEF